MTETPNGDREQTKREQTKREQDRLAAAIQTTNNLLNALYSLTDPKANHRPPKPPVEG